MQIGVAVEVDGVENDEDTPYTRTLRIGTVEDAKEAGMAYLVKVFELLDTEVGTEAMLANDIGVAAELDGKRTTIRIDLAPRALRAELGGAD